MKPKALLFILPFLSLSFGAMANSTKLELEHAVKREVEELEKLNKQVDEKRHTLQEKIMEMASKDEDIVKIAKEVYPYAQMADASYSYRSEPIEGYSRLKKEEHPEKWQKFYIEKNSSVEVPSIAFSAIVFRKNDAKEFVVAFKGTELRAFLTAPNSNTASNLAKFAKNAKTVLDFKLMGHVPEHFKKALELVKDLEAKYKDHSFVFTGSSLAGAISQYVGLMTNHKAYAFNSLAISEAQIQEIKKVDASRIEKADQLITIISLQGDSISAKVPYISKGYLGRHFEIPYYTDHGISYYLSIRHTTDPILTSLDAIINNSRKVWYCSSFKQDQCEKDDGCVWNPKGAQGYQCLSKVTSWCNTAKDENACSQLGCNWSKSQSACLSKYNL